MIKLQCYPCDGLTIPRHCHLSFKTSNHETSSMHPKTKIYIWFFTSKQRPLFPGPKGSRYTQILLYSPKWGIKLRLFFYLHLHILGKIGAWQFFSIQPFFICGFLQNLQIPHLSALKHPEHSLQRRFFFRTFELETIPLHRLQLMESVLDFLKFFRTFFPFVVLGNPRSSFFLFFDFSYFLLGFFSDLCADFRWFVNSDCC